MDKEQQDKQDLIRIDQLNKGQITKHRKDYPSIDLTWSPEKITECITGFIQESDAGDRMKIKQCRGVWLLSVMATRTKPKSFIVRAGYPYKRSALTIRSKFTINFIKDIINNEYLPKVVDIYLQFNPADKEADNFDNLRKVIQMQIEP